MSSERTSSGIPRRTTWLLWSLVALAAVMAALEIVFGVENGSATHSRMSLADWLVVVVTLVTLFVVPVTFTAVGAFILTRLPGNRIGWLMAFIGLGFAFDILTTDYPGISVHTHHPTRPLGTFVAWMSAWDFTLYLVVLLLLLLLFPTGELLSRRWRVVVWIGIFGLVGGGFIKAINSGPLSNVSLPMNNPYAFVTVPAPVVTVFMISALLSLLAALLSLVVRFWTARGIVRQQLKWFTYGAVLAITLDVATIAFGGWSSAVGAGALVATTAMPIFMGIAIMQYRLYEIDVLINRTLVYGSLSVSLALLYVAGVFSLQALFGVVTHQSSGIAIAISTLVIAALFQPLRRVIQSFIDRRFYRSKYDASRTLAAFGARLRDEVDLNQLTGDLLGVVHDTVQPAHVSVWLRDEEVSA